MRDSEILLIIDWRKAFFGRINGINLFGQISKKDHIVGSFQHHWTCINHCQQICSAFIHWNGKSLPVSPLEEGLSVVSLLQETVGYIDYIFHQRISYLYNVCL